MLYSMNLHFIIILSSTFLVLVSADNGKLAHADQPSPHNDAHDHSQHEHPDHHVVLIIAGVLGGVLGTVLLIGIIALAIWLVRRKKKRARDAEANAAGQQKQQPPKNDKASAAKTQHPKAPANGRSSAGNGVTSIFAQSPKGEQPQQESKDQKKKVKEINTTRKKESYMNQIQPDSSINDDEPKQDGGTGNGNAGSQKKVKASKTLGGSKENPEDISTSFEEPESKTLEIVKNPLCTPKAHGPLAPDHISAEKWNHRGQLVLKKRQRVQLKHALENDPHVEPKSTDHVEFDSKMNEVVDFGPGVEDIISNKTSLTTHSSKKKTSKRNSKKNNDNAKSTNTGIPAAPSVAAPAIATGTDNAPAIQPVVAAAAGGMDTAPTQQSSHGTNSNKAQQPSPIKPAAPTTTTDKSEKLQKTQDLTI